MGDCFVARPPRNDDFLFINFTADDGVDPDEEEAAGDAVAHEAPLVDAVIEVFHLIGVRGQHGNG